MPAGAIGPLRSRWGAGKVSSLPMRLRHSPSFCWDWLQGAAGGLTTNAGVGLSWPWRQWPGRWCWCPGSAGKTGCPPGTISAVPAIVAGSVKLGLLESIAVLLFSLASRLLGGVVETIVCGIILVIGLAAVSMLPGLWTRPRTIEGIAGAAGIGLGATAVFLLVDVMLLQNIGTYTNRWYEIGGGSNWWYHPVWWMVGTFIPWMGAWLLANQTTRNGSPSVGQGLITALALALLIGTGATLLGFPSARWGLGTFAVAFLPGLALATLISGIGKRRT